MSKKGKTYKATARKQAERARTETHKMIQRLQKEKDQFGWRSKKVQVNKQFITL